VLLQKRTLPAGFFEPCLPTSTKRPPFGKGWLHEIKHDGFRVIARKNGNQVRLFSDRATISLQARSRRTTKASSIRDIVSPILRWRTHFEPGSAVSG
jgi:hypothetical protein